MSFDPKYSEDREFGDRFLPEVKSIMGRILLTTDYQIEDKERNTDLIVLSMASKRIGMRIRRHKYYNRFDYDLNCHYRDEFTIRCSKDSGHLTEFQKVMDGFGDQFFYGFADEEEKHLCRFVVVDYQMFRRFVFNKLWNGENMDTFIKGRIHRNENNDRFLTFRNDEIPDGIIADSDKWEKVIA